MKCQVIIVLLITHCYATFIPSLDISQMLPELKTRAKDFFHHALDHDIPMLFDPHHGEKLREHFKRVFGEKGQKLVKALGDGLPFWRLRQMGAM